MKGGEDYQGGDFSKQAYVQYFRLSFYFLLAYAISVTCLW